MAAHDVGAVVPVKRLGYALGRLSGVLDRADRRVLQSAMLGDVLAALAGSSRIGEIVVVTSDHRARAVAESVGARMVADHDPPEGINAAVSRGVDALDAHSALVVVSDLPLITPSDVDHLVGAAPAGEAVVLARSEDGTGTNAMLVTPPRARGTTWSKVRSPFDPQYWQLNSSRRKRLKRVKATRFCGFT